MIVNGKVLAQEIALELRSSFADIKKPVTLRVLRVGEDPVTTKYLNRKKTIAESIGVQFSLTELPEKVTEDALIAVVRGMVNDSTTTGVLVQLPLPKHIDTANVLSFIPKHKDPDILSHESRDSFVSGEGLPPPVIGAMQEIVSRYGVAIAGKKAVVVGEGNLVGKPARAWLQNEAAKVVVVNEHTKDPGAVLRDADIVVCGAGVPGLVKPEMLTEGVVVLDAGTTDVSGSLQGDADPTCAEKCSIFTPVPGGIGPLTIVMIYKNLLHLAGVQKH